MELVLVLDRALARQLDLAQDHLRVQAHVLLQDQVADHRHVQVLVHQADRAEALEDLVQEE